MANRVAEIIRLPAVLSFWGHVRNDGQMRTTALVGISYPAGAENWMVRALWIRAIEICLVVDGILPTTGGNVINKSRGHPASFTHGLSKSQQVFIIFKLDVVNTH